MIADCKGDVLSMGLSEYLEGLGHMGGEQLPQKAEVMSGDFHCVDSLRNNGATSYIMIRHCNIFIILRYVGHEWPRLVRCRKLRRRLTRAWTAAQGRTSLRLFIPHDNYGCNAETSPRNG